MKISMNIIKTVGVGSKNFKMALKTVREKVKKLQFLCQQNIFLHKQHAVEAEKRLALNHFCFRIYSGTSLNGLSVQRSPLL